MDVLRPKILVIDGRKYRLNTADNCFNDYNEIMTDNTKKLLPYVERDDSEEEFDDLNICMEGDRFVLKLEAPNMFYGLIVGRNRETLKNLEYKTRTRIKIPGPKENNIISIKGENKSQIKDAKIKIDAIIKRARFKQSMTHFVSLPMVNEMMVANFLTFKNQVLEECGQCRGISEKLFIDQYRLHLTITCFILCDAAEIKRAVNLMKQLDEIIIRPMNLKPLSILVSGLEYMNDNPSEVTVLYAKVESPVLQMLADNIQTFFKDCDLALQPRNDHVKLHVTLMKSRYSESSTFDARNIIETFKDYTFGTVHLTDINLSQRFTTDSNGFYKSSYVLKLQ